MYFVLNVVAYGHHYADLAGSSNDKMRLWMMWKIGVAVNAAVEFVDEAVVSVVTVIVEYSVRLKPEILELLKKKRFVSNCYIMKNFH